MARQALERMLLGLALVTFVACGGSQETAERGESEVRLPPRHRHGNLQRADFDVQTADVNLDNRPDQFTYTSGGRVVWVERDLDFDGRIDLYEYYDTQGAVVEQEFQLDFDDVIDVVRRYENGRLISKEMATGFGGRMNLVKYYNEDGSLLRVERDTNYDGRIDLWEFYRGGRLHQVGEDRDGDGVAEVFRNVQ